MAKDDTNDASNQDLPSRTSEKRISMWHQVDAATKWIRDLIESEPSKWLPILFSLIAIGISSLSWFESRRGRIINEEVNRPILMLNGLETGSWRGRDDLQVTIKYIAKNAGKVEAVLTSGYADLWVIFSLSFIPSIPISN